MRMIEVSYEGLELYVRFDHTDGPCTGIFAMDGRDSLGQYKYRKLDCFTDAAAVEIKTLGHEQLMQELQDEEEEARYIKENCYDTPYA